MTEEAPQLLRIEAFLDDRRRLSREQFLARHSVPVLVIALNSEGAVLEDGGEFRTQQVTVSDPSRPTLPLANLTAVVPIAKRMADPFPAFIWVGREARCDVSLPFNSVSKLQAQFTKKPNGDHEVMDAGSTNGTWVNGQRLEKNKPVTVRDMAQVRFGKMETRFRTADGFYEELAQYL